MSKPTQAESTAPPDQTAGLLVAMEAVQADMRLPMLHHAIAAAAHRLAQGDSASLYLRDTVEFGCVAVHHAGTSADSEPPARWASLPSHAPPLQQMQSSQRAVLLTDDALDPAWTDLLPRRPGAGPIRTWVGVPLTAGERLLGLVGVAHEDRVAYSSEQREILERFARFAGQAVRSALLLAESTARTHRATWRADIAARLRDAAGTREVLQVVAAGLGQALGASSCSAHLWKGGALLAPSAVYPPEGAAVSGALEGMLQPLLAQAALERRTLAATRLDADPCPEAAIRANRESLLSQGVQGLLIAPLLADGEVQGIVLLLQTGTAQPWDAGDIAFAEQVASDTAHALARLVRFEEAEGRVARAKSERDWLRAILDELPAAVVVSELSPHNQVLCNRAAAALAVNGAVFGAGAQGEPLRFDAYTLDGTPYAEAAWPLTRAYQEQSPIEAEEMLVRRRDGERVLVLASAAPLHDGRGQMQGALLLVHPVSRSGGDRLHEQTTALQSLLRAMTMTPNLSDMATTIAETLQGVLPFDALVLTPSDATQDSLGGISTYGPQGDLLPAGLQDLLRRTLARPALELGAPMVYPDLEDAEANAATGALLQSGIRASLLAPITVAGQVVGSLVLFHHRPGAYGTRDMAVAAQVATLLGLAIQQERLVHEAAEAATREERDRLARILHEDLAQTLTGMVMQLDATRQTLPPGDELAARLEQAGTLARSALGETRRVVWDLRLANPDRQTPRALVEEEVAKLARRMNMQPDVLITGEARRIAPEVGLVLQRLARVALENIWMHSGAEHVRVHLDHGLQVLSLLIEDNGQGFEPDAVDLWSGGRVGLAGAAERVRRIGGTLRVESAPGHGTRVYAEIPYIPTAAPAPEPIAAAADAETPGKESRVPIRVVLIDDHTMVREGLVHMLQDQPDLQVVGATATGSDGLRMVEEVKPDVVLCDLQLPDIPGMEVIARLRVHFPGIHCLVVTTFESDDYIFEAIKAGAKGYVLKDVSARELADAVRAVARNESLLQPLVARKMVERLGDLARQGDMVESLTEREVGVLQALAGGARNKEIAFQLGLSESTIKTHLASIFGKLGVTTRTEAVSRGRELGLIPL